MRNLVHEPLLMGIDIGTSACKTAVFRADGTVAAASTREYPVYYPAPGWVEQDCEQWWSAVCAAIRDCLDVVPAGDIAGIGVDGQSWSCIPVDRDGNVLAKTPIWMDMRCAALCGEVLQEVGHDRIFQVAKNPFQPSYTTPKILWFRQRHPEIYHNTACFLQSNSYIVFRLTGVLSQDKSQGYGLHVYDMAKGCYDTDLCRELKIDPDRLAPIFDCHTVVGHVTRRAFEETGLPTGIPVVAGGLDAACGTLGAGVYRPGQTQEQGGQAGGMSICEDHPAADPRLILSNHVVPGLWLLQGGTVAGGASYKWAAETLGQYEASVARQTGQHQMFLMDREAAAVPAGSDGMIFLPYLSGERSPIWDPDACGMFFGLSFGKGRGHFYRAVLEGAAYALRHNLEIARQTGAQVTEMNSIGGAAASPLWMQIKSDVTGTPMCVPRAETATTLGAALLAGVGTGVYSGFEQAVSKTIRIEKEYRPDPEMTKRYTELFGLYLQLYEANKDVMKAHAAVVRAMEDLK